MMTKAVFHRRPHAITQVLSALRTLPDNCAGLHIQMKVNDEEALAYLDHTEEDGIYELAQFLYERRDAFRSPAVGRKALEVLESLSPPDVPVVTVLIEVPRRDSRRIINTLHQFQRQCPGMKVEIA